MSFFDRKRIQERREARIEFLGVQVGTAERELMNALELPLSRHESIKRAYLARIGFRPHEPTSIALCIAPKDAESARIVEEVSGVFRKLFAEGVALDILFLTAMQEEDLRRVCQPFFNREILDE